MSSLRENITIMYLLISFENFVTSCTTPSHTSHPLFGVHRVLALPPERIMQTKKKLEITLKTYNTHVTFKRSVTSRLFSLYVFISFSSFFYAHLTNYPRRKIVLRSPYILLILSFHLFIKCCPRVHIPQLSTSSCI